MMVDMSISMCALFFSCYCERVCLFFRRCFFGFLQPHMWVAATKGCWSITTGADSHHVAAVGIHNSRRKRPRAMGIHGYVLPRRKRRSTVGKIKIEVYLFVYPLRYLLTDRSVSFERTVGF